MSEIKAIKSHQQSNAEQWAAHIARWEVGNLSQPEYCKQAGIGYASFVYWRSKLSSESKSPQVKFMPVSLEAKKSSYAESPKSIQIKLVSGHVVYIPATLPALEIAALINAIGNSNA
jgi:hypothetical protein